MTKVCFPYAYEDESIYPDAHEIITRDAKIMQLESELKLLCTHLEHTTKALEFYKKEPNGYIATQILNLITNGGN